MRTRESPRVVARPHTRFRNLTAASQCHILEPHWVSPRRRCTRGGCGAPAVADWCPAQSEPASPQPPNPARNHVVRPRAPAPSPPPEPCRGGPGGRQGAPPRAEARRHGAGPRGRAALISCSASRRRLPASSVCAWPRDGTLRRTRLVMFRATTSHGAPPLSPSKRGSALQPLRTRLPWPHAQVYRYIARGTIEERMLELQVGYAWGCLSGCVCSELVQGTGAVGAGGVACVSMALWQPVGSMALHMTPLTRPASAKPSRRAGAQARAGDGGVRRAARRWRVRGADGGPAAADEPVTRRGAVGKRLGGATRWRTSQERGHDSM